MFPGCTVPPDNKETETGSSGQEASPSTGRNNEVVLVKCSRMEVRPTAISGGVDMKPLGVICYDT